MRIYHRHHAKGFTLVEIMIVVAIIALIASVAIPNLLRARLNANTSAAIGDLATINSALQSDMGAANPKQYSATLVALSAAAPPYIDAVLGAGARHGYNFIYAPVVNAATGLRLTYTLNANPISPGVSGQRTFFSDESGVIRSAAGPAAATVGDPALD